MLYIFNKDLTNNPLLNLIKPHDTLILMEDGVYNIMNNNLAHIKCHICAIKDDLLARHINNTSVKSISYEEFVHICATHEKICQQ